VLKRFITLSLLLILLAAGAAYGLYWDVTQFSHRPMKLGEDRSLTVERGQALRGVAQTISDAGWVDRPPEYLIALARLGQQAHRIHAGEYRIPLGTTPQGLLNLLVDGQVVQHTLTIVEGWSFAQLLAAVRASPVLEQTLEDLTPAGIMGVLGRPDEHPEGRFFPDTYHFPRGTTDVEFLARAYVTMERVLAQEWAGRAQDIPLETPYQALILASIVEKETGAAFERPEISGVFTRRLQKGMRLQTDPTVIYGIGPAFDGNIRRSDLRRDTPYNTYTRSGLPPTPIALPGRESIHAAVHPAPGKSLYFVSRGDGTHQFSDTLKAHNQAVRTHQLKQ
jgi:UPF0755 protein